MKTVNTSHCILGFRNSPDMNNEIMIKIIDQDNYTYINKEGAIELIEHFNSAFQLGYSSTGGEEK